MPADISQLSRPARAGYFCSNLVLRALIGLALLVPYRWRVPMMGWLVSRVLSPLAGGRKRIRNNLKLVMPELPEAEVHTMMNVFTRCDESVMRDGCNVVDAKSTFVTF